MTRSLSRFLSALLPAAVLAGASGCAGEPGSATSLPADRPASSAVKAADSVLAGAGPAWGLTHGRAVDLPKPYATRSASNASRVVPPPPGTLPSVPYGYSVAIWTTDVKSPRHMALAPNGDVFVAESRRNRVSVFRDADGDGKPESRFVFTENISQPFGIAFVEGWVYVARTDYVVRYPYKSGQTRADAPPETVTNLTEGGYNQHWTRALAVDPKTGRMFVSVGSRSNADEEPEPRAGILVMETDGSGRRMFATGLRNPVDMAFQPDSGRLWTVVNERDGLGDDVPPDYLTEVRDGGFYGWPWYYIGQHNDPRLPERPDLRGKVIIPDVLVGPHTAPLGLAFNPGGMLPGRGDAFVALHGSWNRSEREGYKVVRVPFRDGKPSGPPEDLLTGFVLNKNDVWGRPVGVLFLKDGSLLASEDGNDIIYRVTHRG